MTQTAKGGAGPKPGPMAVVVLLTVLLAMVVLPGWAGAQEADEGWRGGRGASVIVRPVELTPADLEHGKRQVERMLADRPGMTVYRQEKEGKAGYVGEADAIYRWAVEAYAGKYVGERVYWSYVTPEDGAAASHGRPTIMDLFSVMIRDTSGEGRGEFEHMWSSLFYEMANMSFNTEWMVAEQAALDKACSAEEFVKRCAKVEWRALGELGRLREAVWLPWAASAGVKSEAQYWSLPGQEDFETWLSAYTDRSGYPWSPYLENYERLGQATASFRERHRKLLSRAEVSKRSDAQ